MLTITDLKDDFRLALVESAKTTATQNGIILDIVEADASIEKQVLQIKNAAEQGYYAIICNPVDTSTTLQLEAMSDGLPIVFINSAPDENLLKADQYMYVGSDEHLAGKYQAEYVLQQLSSSNEINVVLLKGEKGHSGAEGRTDAVKNVLEASGKTIHYVFEDNADWSQETSEYMISLFLKTGKSFDCIIANNDSMALGAAKALKDNGISKPILGVDATNSGCQAIKDGDLVFTVFQSAALQGNAAVQTAIALGSEESAGQIDGVSEDGKCVYIPFEKVDKTNVNKYLK